jgi:hypothetical protein
VDAVACETSADCGALKCIEGVCRDPNAPETSAAVRTLGHHAWFGSQTGYGVLVAVMDAGAAAVEPFLLLGANKNSGPPQTFFGIMCFVPVTITGSTVHFAHGRAFPGIISFFAWASHVGTTFALAGLVGLSTHSDLGEFNNDAAWAMGLVFGALGGIALTTLDVWMARPIARKHTTQPTLSIAPTFAPTRGGGLVGVGASF